MSGNLYGRGELNYSTMSHSTNLLTMSLCTLHNLGIDSAVPRTVYVTDIDLNKKLRLEPEDTATLVATALPHNADLKTVTWASDDKNVATVDKDGVVTAVGVGTAKITATSDMVEEIVAECDVTVAVFVTGVTLDQETLALTFGGTDGTLTATIAPATATDKTLIWISSDEEVATVEEGVVTSVGGGTAIITVTTTDGGFTAECEVTVNVLVTGVTLDEEILTLQSNGATGTLVATIAPTTATNKNVTWTSSDETYATVEDGVVTPLAIGGATITATTEDGGFTDTCNIIVTISVTGVTLDKDTLSLIAGGEVGTLIATVTPENAVVADVTWTSSDESIATVSGGIVTPMTMGTAIITATTVDGEFTDTCEVTVTGAE